MNIKYLAQVTDPGDGGAGGSGTINIGKITGQGILGDPGANAPTLFENFLSGALGILTIIAGIWFVFLVFTGAIGIISSGGEKGAYENARNRISTGVIGIVVVIAAIFVVDLVGTLLGVNLLNPAEFITSFTLN
ncbi:hypothetical protein C4564_04745 [Candidatus Microgenomates bacterium]|nr:MAG: hypothetical protein C4564_04745 [Candidatus Microgenomates bacterium]